MRYVLASALLIALCVSASAASVHHARTGHHVVVPAASKETVPPGWYKFPGYPPIPPELNRNLDPSNRGGG